MITLDTARRHSNADLLSAAARLAAAGREVTADLVALLAVLVERALYAGEGYASAHDFCVGRLSLSDAQAYHRLAAAQAAARFPQVLEGLRSGTLTLTNVALLRPHLTEANGARLLAWAEGRRKHEVERLVRSLAPRPDVAPSLRRLPAPGRAAMREVAAWVGPLPERPAPASCDVPPSLPASGSAGGLFTMAPDSDIRRASLARALGDAGECDADGAPSHAATCDAVPCHAVVCDAPSLVPPPAAGPGPAPDARIFPAPSGRAEIRPLSPARYSLRVTISEETHAKLRRARDLLGHAVPGGDFAEVLDRALTLLVERLEQRKCGAKKRRGVQPPAPARRPRAGALPTHATVNRPTAPGLVRGGTGRGTPSAPRPDADLSDVASPAGPPRSRYIPAAVRRAVWERDQGQCAFVGPQGRCAQTRRLEFHHRVPFAEGGASSAENLVLACVLHNHWEAERWFGEESFRAGARPGRDASTARSATAGAAIILTSQNGPAATTSRPGS